MSEWKKVKLGEITIIKTGKLDSNAAVPNGAYPFFTCDPTTLSIDKWAYDTEAILLAGNNASGNYTAKYYKGKFNAYQRTYIIETLNPQFASVRYMAYAMNQQLQLLKVMSSGSTTKFLTMKMLTQLSIDLPSIETQHRIATILSRYDSLIENYQKQIKLLEEAAQRLYKEWFVDLHFPGHENTKIVDGVPEGWEKKRIGDIVEYFDKQRKPLSSMQRMSMDKIYPYYGAATLMDYVENYLFDGIYLLLGEDGTVITPDNYPVLQYVWGKFWVNNHAHVLRGKDNISTEFLYAMFKEMPIADVVTGAAQPKISQGRLSEKKVLIPPIQLILKWSDITKAYFDSYRNLSDKIRLLTEARDRLLPKLMSGEIAV
jgi:type I restriction enzyme S subunit